MHAAMTSAHRLLGILGWAMATVDVVFSGGQNLEVTDASLFRARADLVTLPVTVTDDRQQYVSGLDVRHFQVFENGRPQTLTFFQSTPTPLTVTLVLDTSASMAKVLPIVTKAALAFIHDLDRDDVASVVAFNERVRVLQGFTGDRDALERAVPLAKRGDSTSLYTALYVALKELELAKVGGATAARRRVLILFSDGADTTSLMPLEGVLETAASADTVIYTIRLEASTPATDPASDTARFLLRRLTDQTGGRAFFPVRAGDVLRAFKAIRSELAHQYTLAFVSTDGTGSAGLHQLSVIVERPGAVARTRRGYFMSRR